MPLLGPRRFSFDRAVVGSALHSHLTPKDLLILIAKYLNIRPKPLIITVGLLIIAIRLITLPFPDLVDTTEGRYAGVAQIMLERDDWVTPWIHYEGVNQPYLGKPPLHFWLVQTSFLIFGQNNFASRLPGVVSGLGIGIALWIGALSLLGIEAAIVSVAVFASCCMTFFLSGSVLLDVTLTLGITMTLVSLLLIERYRGAGYMAFVGLALAMLTKGPLAGILIGCVVAPWLIIHRILNKSWPQHLLKVPWVTGAVLFLVLTLPWYIWAESRNPGFLHYFIFNENLGRYFNKNYVDEYGSGHRQPFGAAFLMMLLAVFPWSFILLTVAASRAKSILSKGCIKILGDDPLLLFALCWAFSCPLLLLGATQYTATYLMPAVPGFGFLVGVLWSRFRKEGNRDNATSAEDSLTKLLVIAGAILLVAWGIISIGSFRFMASVSIILFSLGLALLVALLFKAILKSHFAFRQKITPKSLTLILGLTLISTLLYGSATLCLNDYLSTNRSSRRVLELARKLRPSDAPLRIGFPFYFPFSAWFYRSVALAAGDKVIEVRDTELATAEVDMLVVRKRNVNRLIRELPSAKEVGSVGQWRIFTRMN